MTKFGKLFFSGAVFLYSVALPELLLGEESGIQFGYDDVKRHLVIIEHSRGSGSGFIAELGGNTYLFTNQHVVLGCDSFIVRTHEGTRIRYRGCSFAEEGDLIRFRVSGVRGLQFASELDVGTPVVVYGNSGGQGVFTALEGRIEGIGPDRLEVSSDFIAGNSGSPILDPDMNVVGVATYVTRSSGSPDWINKGTRFTEPRRFGLRITPAKQWRQIPWHRYAMYGRQVLETRREAEALAGLFMEWARTPFLEVSSQEFRSDGIHSWIAAQHELVEEYRAAQRRLRMTPSSLAKTNRRISSSLSELSVGLQTLCGQAGRRINGILSRSERIMPRFHQQTLLQTVESLEKTSEQIEKYKLKVTSQEVFGFR